jgi:hypothetical protein
MSEKLEYAIGSALEGDAVGFKDAITKELESKVAQAINLKKMEYSAALFKDKEVEQEEDQNQEEDSDETVQ